MKILFSPVGGSDPMSEKNFHDGALLHIARHYKPDKIILFFSKKMMDYRDSDRKIDGEDRYHYCLRKLGELIEHPFQVEDVDCPELEVFLFDPVFKEMEKNIFSIIDTMNPEDELLVNITSGTPPMQSSLLIIATMLDIPYKCIQADTPVRDQNEHQHSRQYDVKERWELNCDNDYTPDDENYNRTHEEKLISLKRLKYEEVIRKHINAYDYHAAYQLAKAMPSPDTENYLIRLQTAAARYAMDFDTVNRLFPRIERKSRKLYRPIENQESREIFEYVLRLQACVNREEFGDFLRGLSPAIEKLFENVIETCANIRIRDYTRWDGAKYIWDLNRLNQNPVLRNATFLNGRTQVRFIQTYHLIDIMTVYNLDPNMIREMQKLRDIEKDVRNLAAHTMVAVSDEWVRRKTGYTCRRIKEMLKAAFQYTGFNINSQLWDSYETMNDDIFSFMKG